MAVVDMAVEETATQLFRERSEACTGCFTLKPVGRLCKEYCLLMSKWRSGTLYMSVREFTVILNFSAFYQWY